MDERKVFPLFSTPVYINNVGELDKPDVEALEYSSTVPAAAGQYNFLSSVDKNVLDRPGFEHVRGVIMRELEFYSREVLVVNRGIELYITNSWVNRHGRGHSAGAHMHHNSLISGVLYLKAAENCGDIVFHRDTLSLVPFPPALDLDVDHFNLYNCKSWGYPPKTNDICLFPSVVSHSVDPNQSNEERWCLAFNVFVRGHFGRLHQLSIK